MKYILGIFFVAFSIIFIGRCTSQPAVPTIELDFADNYKPSQGTITFEPRMGIVMEYHEEHQTSYYLGKVVEVYPHEFQFTRVLAETEDCEYVINTKFVIVYDYDAGEEYYKLFYGDYLIGYFYRTSVGEYTLEYIDYSHLEEGERSLYLQRL